MDDALACRHPLDVAWPNGPFVSFEVLMVDDSFLHVRYCFEASVRVVRESGGQSHSEMVEHQERVEPPQVLVPNHSNHLRACPLILPARLEHKRHFRCL